MVSAGRAERRAMVERLLLEDHLRSDRSIACACGGSHALVGTVRAELVAAGRIDRRPDRPEADAQAGGGRNANLTRARRGEPGPALRHGAHSERRVAPIRERILEDLRREFTGVADDLLVIQAHRRAQYELLMAEHDERGIVQAGKRREITPASQFAERIGASYERQHVVLVELQAAGGAGRRLTLADIEAEPDEDEDVADGGEGS